MAELVTTPSTAPTPTSTEVGARRRRGHWIEDWDPEDERKWEEGGSKVARRNLGFSILSEHLGFSVWSLWSIIVVFMTPEIGFTFDPGQKFLLVSVPTLVGAILRVPYTLAVPKFGGRNWTIFSSLLLFVPTVLLAIFIQDPTTSFGTFLLVAATAGVGGGNFASSMANISYFYPERKKGWALGLNAGGGNLGVPVVQLIGLVLFSLFTGANLAYLAALYLPFIALAAVCAALFMDNLSSVRADVAAQVAVLREKHTWVMSFLYIGTFGSFIGYSFAFGLVLQTQFGYTPLQAAAVTFIGPLVGSLIRPVGGALADRYGGALVTFLTFIGMGAAVVLIMVASSLMSFGMFLVSFILLFALSGVGNGSTYKMIPAIFRAQAKSRAVDGADEAREMVAARRLAAALIGWAGAIGALGGVAINLAFRASYMGEAKSGTAAYISFLAFYAICVAVTYVVYLRRPAGTPAASDRV